MGTRRFPWVSRAALHIPPVLAAVAVTTTAVLGLVLLSCMGLGTPAWKGQPSFSLLDVRLWLVSGT